MYSRLIKGQAARRALKELVKVLAQNDLARRVRGDLGTLKPASVSLPGFDLFSRTASHRVLDWALPKPRGDLVDYIYAYEGFVNAKLGAFRDPSRLAGEVYKGMGCRRDFFKGSVRAGSWFTPAVVLVAIGQHYNEDQSVLVDGTTYSLHVGPAFVSVSPTQVYSNTAKGFIEVKRPPDDRTLTQLRVGALETTHELASAVFKHGDELDLYGVGWMLNSILRARRAGMLSDQHIYQAFQKADNAGGGRQAARAAYDEALEVADRILRSESVSIVYPLYEAIVPTVCDHWTFRSFFGNPYRDLDRRVSTATRARWRKKLAELVEEGPYAD